MSEDVDVTSDSSEAIDLREARSRRYTDAMRIMLLDSGNWALSDMANGEITIVAEVTDDLLREVALIQRERYREYCRGYEEKQKSHWGPLREGKIEGVETSRKHTLPAAHGKPYGGREGKSAKAAGLSFEELFGPKG